MSALVEVLGRMFCVICRKRVGPSGEPCVALQLGQNLWAPFHVSCKKDSK